jgi:hypothetical protein
MSIASLIGMSRLALLVLLVLVGCTTVPPAPRTVPQPSVAVVPQPPAPPPVVVSAVDVPRPLPATPLASPLASAPPAEEVRAGTVQSLVSEQSASTGSSAPASAAPPYRMMVRLDDGKTVAVRELSLRFRAGDRVGVLPDGRIIPLRPAGPN